MGLTISNWIAILALSGAALTLSAQAQPPAGGSNTLSIPLTAPTPQFDASIAADLAQKLPHKPIHVRTVGGQSDQAIAAKYIKYLMDHAFEIKRPRSLRGL